MEGLARLEFSIRGHLNLNGIVANMKEIFLKKKRKQYMKIRNEEEVESFV